MVLLFSPWSLFFYLFMCLMKWIAKPTRVNHLLELLIGHIESTHEHIMRIMDNIAYAWMKNYDESRGMITPYTFG